MASDRRLDLHALLVDIIGSKNVYFQRPPSTGMRYPCIFYKRDSKNEKFSNNMLYIGTQRYLVTVIDEDPDSEIPDKISQLRHCSFESHYVAENLNHDVYSLYY